MMRSFTSLRPGPLALAAITAFALAFCVPLTPASAQYYEPLPPVEGGADDAYRPVNPPVDDPSSYGSDSVYNRGSQPYDPNYDDIERRRAPEPEPVRRPRDDDYGVPYERAAPNDGGGPYYDDAPPRDGQVYRDERDLTYSQEEIVRAGHGFFGSVSEGLARAVAYAFQKAGRPNGYILGEDAGGAFFAGLRYGEGRLHSRKFGTRKVYWQGPTLGYDFGAEGAKTMVLVYNLRDPSQLFARFGGVEGSAYLVGGVGVQLQKRGDVTLAPIRAGVGLRLGANVGYLKYTRRPTWNPF